MNSKSIENKLVHKDQLLENPNPAPKNKGHCHVFGVNTAQRFSGLCILNSSDLYK